MADISTASESEKSGQFSPVSPGQISKFRGKEITSPTDIGDYLLKRNYAIVGKGKEAKIYQKGHYILKVYKQTVSLEKILREFDFLAQHANGGVVPLVYSSRAEVSRSRVIAMEYLTNYQNLSKVLKNKKNYTLAQMMKMFIELAKARISIGKHIEYKDLHEDNVLVKFQSNGIVSVKLIDPGNIVTYQKGADIWVDWVIDIIKKFKLTHHNALYKALRSRNTHEIKKILGLHSKKTVTK